MRAHALLVAALLCLTAFHARAEESAAELEAKGIAALKLSQNESDAVVAAAIYLGQAAEAYDQAHDDTKATEMNSFLYWCKKKMTIQQMDAFLKGDVATTTAVAKRLKVLDEAPKVDEAQTYFNRADAYANSHPNEHLLIAVRFYEVADRFKGSELSLQAMDRSLKEMTLEKTSNGNVVQKENPAAAPPPGKKAAIPALAQQKEAERTIKDLYRDDFTKTTTQDKLALAIKLERQADESTNDAAARYVLLVQASMLAGQAGDLERLSAIFDKLISGFESEFKDFMKAQLSVAIPKVSDVKQAKVAVAMRSLIDKPDDAASNLTLGKYKLLRGDVERAAALIAKSKNATLITLLKQEQAAQQDSTLQVASADAWWDASEKISDKDDKSLFRVHALVLYEKALPSLTGLVKAKVEKRVMEAAMETLLPNRSKAINVLKLIDINRDVIKGEWKMEGGALFCTKSDLDERLQLNIKASPEYDLHVVFAKLSGPGGSGIVLLSHGQQVKLVLDGFFKSISGLHKIDGNMADNNPTRTIYQFEMGVDYDLIVQVRDKSIRAFINGKELFIYRFEKPNFSLNNEWKLRDTHSFGVSCNTCTERFKVFEIMDVDPQTNK